MDEVPGSDHCGPASAGSTSGRLRIEHISGDHTWAEQDEDLTELQRRAQVVGVGEYRRTSSEPRTYSNCGVALGNPVPVSLSCKSVRDATKTGKRQAPAGRSLPLNGEVKGEI
jgi:hypothetical protein